MVLLTFETKHTKTPLNIPSPSNFVNFHAYKTYWLINCNVCFCPPGKEDRDLETDFVGVISKVLWSLANNFLVFLNIFLHEASRAFLDSSSGSPML